MLDNLERYVGHSEEEEGKKKPEDCVEGLLKQPHGMEFSYTN